MKNSSLLKISILSLSGLFVVAQLYIPIPLVTHFAQIFLISNTQAVWIGSAFGFSYACGFLVFGPLSDKFGRRKLLIPGLFMLAITSILVGFTESFSQMIFLRVIQGFAAATFAPSALAYIGEQLPIENRSTGVAFISTGFMLAGIIGQIFASQVYLLLNWHWIFWITGFFYALLGLSIALYLDEQKDENKSTLSLFSFYHAILKHLKNTTLLKAYLCTLTLLFAFVAMYTGFSPYLIQKFDFNSADMFLVRLAGVPGMLLGPFTGRFIKKYGSDKVLIVGFSLAILGIFVEGVSSEISITIAASTCFVAGIAISAPALIAIVSTVAEKNKGAAISLYTFILFIGASLGSIFANSISTHGFMVLCLTIMCVLIISITIFSFSLYKVTFKG